MLHLVKKGIKKVKDDSGVMRNKKVDKEHLETDPHGLVGLLLRLGSPLHVCFEHLHAAPMEGVVSVFSLGQAAGMVTGVLAGMGIPYTRVRPEAWKKALMAGMSKDKGESVVRASQLYPQIADQLRGPRGRALDGRADALLLAHWLRLQQPVRTWPHTPLQIHQPK